MDKTQLQEYLRLDLNIKELEDNTRRNGNKQWQLKKEIMKIGDNTRGLNKKIEEYKKQQYRILGRSYIKLEKPKKRIKE